MERRVRRSLGTGEASEEKTGGEGRSEASDVSESVSSEPVLSRAAALRRCHSLMVWRKLSSNWKEVRRSTFPSMGSGEVWYRLSMARGDASCCCCC